MPKQLVTLILIFICAFSAFAQSEQEKLEKRKAQILLEIRKSEDMIKEIRQKEKSVAQQIEEQKKKIQLKESLIRTTERQTRLLNDDIYLTQLKINKLKRELEVAKEDYAEMIRKSYKSRSEQSRAMFLLSSENFLQAYKRGQYMNQYASYRRSQGMEIKDKTLKLENYGKELERHKQEKERLLAENEQEKEGLLKEKQEQEKLVSSMQKDRKAIAAQIKKKQEESRKIDRQIDALIKKAIAEANRKAAAAAAKTSAAKGKEVEKKTAAAPNKIVLTPEGKVVADNFRANKGRLPWPVEKGVITLRYGNVPHPDDKNIMVHNNGVDITTDSNASARAVFGGEVIAVLKITPVKMAVVIQHGDFFTIYHNLGSVNVAKGDKVKLKQNLGKINTSGNGKTILKFSIKQNVEYMNPQSWLAGA